MCEYHYPELWEYYNQQQIHVYTDLHESLNWRKVDYS